LLRFADNWSSKGDFVTRGFHHLSGLDATFLHLESPEMPMHVGGLHLFELPAGYQGDFYEDVKRHIASRMHLAPAFRRKLLPMPFDLANPVWMREPDVDLDYHVRRIVLSKPGSMAQLEAYVGRLHSSLLDRSRPLWEIYVMEGLADGQIAMYSKLHHAAVDGQAAVELARVLFDVVPEGREIEPPEEEEPEDAPTVRELLSAGASNSLEQLRKFAQLVPTLAKGGVKLVAAGLLPPRFGGSGGGLPKFSRGPRTPLNVAITNQRNFTTTKVDLAGAKLVAKALGVTINDIVLATCSGALRRWLDEHGGIPDKPLSVAVPFSLRESGDATSNNQVSMMLADLATHVDDPAERLKAIRASMLRGKAITGSLRAGIPTDYPSIGAPWLVSGLAALFGRSQLANTMAPIANVVVSNVPGPQVPLYLAGARMTGHFPVSIVVHSIALNITVQSYCGAIEFGLTACKRAVPDVAKFKEHIQAATAEYATLARTVTGAAHGVPARPARTVRKHNGGANAETAAVAPARARKKRSTKPRPEVARH
jgi:WS/DGAT/MGAT family acyltransferase